MTSTSSSAATARAPTAPGSSGGTTFPTPSSSPSTPETSCLEGSSPCTTAAVAPRRPVWLPEQRALVFADALTERGGELRVWGTPWHEERVLPALRVLLDLPFEHVIVSHGEPVHGRAAFERALDLAPFAEDA